MSTTGNNCSRRADDGDPSIGDTELTSPVVTAFRNRFSDKGVGDRLPESADRVGEVEEPAAVHPPDPAGGEVLLW